MNIKVCTTLTRRTQVKHDVWSYLSNRRHMHGHMLKIQTK